MYVYTVNNCSANAFFSITGDTWSGVSTTRAVKVLEGHTRHWPNAMKGIVCTCQCVLLCCMLVYVYSKGDLESAIKHLELYVEVADRAGEQAMARACSAIGIMSNTLV